jgi:hypothetical protein
MNRFPAILPLCIFLVGFDFGPLPVDQKELVPEGVENRGLTCTAMAVYYEARGESWFGQALVAKTVLNRQQELPYGSDACDVVLEPGQFEGVEKVPYPRRPWRDEPVAWAHALEVATVVMTGDYNIPFPCTGVDHFKVRSEPPLERWGTLVLTCTVGGHDFYAAAPSTGATATTILGPRP